ncbi:YwmB family TATA-box binding protein [Alteribacter aurantiacus]|uniref:YwmB family TATA-box binding protein n=1 Tax=Alteribacter aurantiacus TaxID=254410 RepID=UPI000407C65F|nr:YwmB family TATA-box binding protein [Alteribacter aurantiacus]
MERYTVVLGSLVLIFLLWVGVAQGNDNSDRDLKAQSPLQTIQQMNDKMTDHAIRTSRWHIYARDNDPHTMTKRSLAEFVQQYQEQLSMFDWAKVEEESENEVWEGVRTDINQTVTEKVTLTTIRVAEDDYRTYLTYNASMLPVYHKDNQGFSMLFENVQSPEWLSHAEFFVRAEGVLPSSDTTDVEQWGLDITESFSANVVESLEEPSFVSISAYAPFLGSNLETKGEPMNLQIALRKNEQGLGGETTVTIGTPIITAEY